MAYYKSNYLEGSSGEYQDSSSSYTSYDVVPSQYLQSYCNSEPQYINYNHSTSYDVVPFQSLQSYSVYEIHEPQYIEYSHYSSYDASQNMYSSYDPKLIEYADSCDPCYVNNSEINYSMHTLSEPTVVKYDPASYQKQYFISYKTVTFNELNNMEYDPTPYDGIYDKYDPTPYDGGYDQTVTYGKPLPPSDQICYPRSDPKPTALSPDDGFSYSSTPSPYGNHDSSPDASLEEIKAADDGGEERKSNGNSEGAITEPIDLGEEKESNGELESEQFDLGEEKQSNDELNSALVEQYDMGNGANIEGFNNGHDYPWLVYDYGHGDGKIGGYDKYNCDEQIVAQTQHGYGSDGVNYCESIFGYWPCLAKKNKKTDEYIQENCDTINGSDLPKETDLCKETAEYIFGSSLVCEEASGTQGHSHESHYRQPPCYGQEIYHDKCDDSSWIHKLSIF